MSLAAEAAHPSTPCRRPLLPLLPHSLYKFMKKDSRKVPIVRWDQLRRSFLLVLVLAVGLAASSAASAGRIVAKTSGAAYVQLKDGAGYASVRVRGNFFGRVERGRIVATRNVSMNGCERRRLLANGFVRCRGRMLTFKTPVDSRWRVRMRGRGISATGFVRGCLRLNGRDTGSTGFFRVGMSSSLRAWPRDGTSYRLGSGRC
jgi:hypothetical protein